MKIGVLALQGDFEEHIAMLRTLGSDVSEVRLPEQLQHLDGLVIPGGESTTISRLLDRWQLLDPIRRRAREGMAIWGTCAGAILLAERAPDLDREGLRLMDIGVERNAFGRQVDSFEADVAVPAFAVPEFDDSPFHAIFIRAPRILDIGSGAVALASLENGVVVAARQDKLLATVFHPELTDDTRFHQYFLDLAAKDPAASLPQAGRTSDAIGKTA